MLLSWWRRLWKRTPGPSTGNRLPANRRPAFRPLLEALEDRMLPSSWAGGIAPYASEAFAAARPALAAAAHVSLPLAWAAAPAVGGGLQPLRGAPAEGASRMTVTVEENSSATVIDLGAVFGAVRGIRHADGLQLAMLGNTNPALVKTTLSEAELTLTCAAGKSGKATLTVSATDADGVSVQETLVVTVLPRNPGGKGESAIPTGAKGW
jgi:hypothetical protein